MSLPTYRLRKSIKQRKIHMFIICQSRPISKPTLDRGCKIAVDNAYNNMFRHYRIGLGMTWTKLAKAPTMAKSIESQETPGPSAGEPTGSISALAAALVSSSQHSSRSS